MHSGNPDRRFEEHLVDVFRDIPEFDNLSVNLRLNQQSPIQSQPDFPSFRAPVFPRMQPMHPRSDRERDVEIPGPLRGVPMLEHLYCKNRDDPSARNGFLMRVLTHETVLYRGYMESKRRVRRLAKYMDRTRRLEGNRVNHQWIVELSQILQNPKFQFAPEQFQSFYLQTGKFVKLGIPTSRDEIVLDAMRLVLDAIFEPRFSDFSFGFRPGRGRQIALRNLKNHIRGMDWYIVAETSLALQQLRGFELVKAACQQIHDPAFAQLLYKALDTGYVNTYGLRSESFVSVPKEMGITPVLLNCHLDAFDKWMEIYRVAYSDSKKPIQWKNCMPGSPPDYRKLRFLRCGASIFFGLRGSKNEANCIAMDVQKKLGDLEMDPSLIDVKVHRAGDHKRSTDRAMFLGYEISRESVPTDMPPSLAQSAKFETRALLYIPTLKLRECFKENGFIRFSKLKTWTPFGNGSITHWPVEHIVRYFDRLTVGLLEFYAQAHNFRQLHWFVYILKRSCNLTMGRKLKLRSMRKVFVKYGRDLEVKDGETIVATLPDRRLSVRPIVKDFFPELTPYLRRRRFITRGTRSRNSRD